MSDPNLIKAILEINQTIGLLGITIAVCSLSTVIALTAIVFKKQITGGGVCETQTRSNRSSK